MKSIVILGLFFLFSIQTHGAGKWRERASRFLPFVAPKARKLEKWEQRRKAQIKQMLTSLSDLELMVFDLELKNNTYNIEILKEMAALAREEIFLRIGEDEQAKILDMLAPSLTARLDSILNNPVTAPHFFEVFQDAARGDLPERYRDILREFLSANNENIMALDPTPKELQGMIETTRSIDTSINILREALDGEKSAGKFFAAFETVAWDSPSKEYQKALNDFFTEHSEAIGKLPFSAEQVKYISNYVYYVPTFLTLLKGGLQRDNGDGNRFFSIFKAVTDYTDKPDDGYQKALNKFFTNNAEEIGKLRFSTEQAKHIGEQVHYVETYITLLQGSLKRAKGNASLFLDIFKAVTDFSGLGDKYQDALGKFLVGNAEEIAKLRLSPKRIRYIAGKVLRIKTNISFMQTGLNQAQGNASSFFEIFDAIADVDNYSPNKAYRDALNNFFMDNAEKIMNLNPSLEQIVELNNFIGRSSTSIKILELALERAEYAGDFFNVFHVIAANAPRNSKHIYGHFLTDHARKIVDLGPSPDQMEKISKYVSSPEILFDMAKNQKKKQRGRKKREVCAANMAILLSLGHFPESTENEI